MEEGLKAQVIPPVLNPSRRAPLSRPQNPNRVAGASMPAHGAPTPYVWIPRGGAAAAAVPTAGLEGDD